ncbi:YncE family protein [Corallococcus interemptor]|uniref:YncE family protein n=1 Tax=Corallococcus interemptor TaxID=2316720 RepID=UPI003D04D6A0
MVPTPQVGPSTNRWRTRTGLLCAAVSLFASTPAAAQAPSFIEFESAHVRPLALSPDGTKLFAVNTPDNRLEVFNVTSAGLSLVAEVPVGLEPVSVAARSNTEVWVVNHLSDSVSVVSVSGTPHVVRTLLVGDEPRDIVFAGANGNAFITTAHRGQQRTDPSIASVPGAGDPQLTTPGVGRADVWVFNPASLGTTLGGTPVRILTLFGDTPRGLAVSPDKKTVYAAIAQSGNRTTTINMDSVCNGFGNAGVCLVQPDTFPWGNNLFVGGLPGPSTNVDGARAPETGLIVKWNSALSRWEDTLGRNWNNGVRFNLPDKDVFAIDADGLQQKAFYTGVGTTVFNLATNPKTGAVYATNSDANNLTRFEGPGAFGGSTVQGNIAKMRITVIKGTTVSPRHLNKHLDYSKLAGSPGFDSTAKNHSLSTPTEMAVSSDGTKLYVAAFSSSKVGVFDTAALEADTFNPRTASANYIPVTGGGPSGLVLDEARNRLYVMTRFDNAVKVIDLATKSQLASAALYNPEPDSVVQGRPFLYDANFSSANGEASCASCHVFGDKDELAWDLGNPDDAVTTNAIDKRLASNLEIGAFRLLTGHPSSDVNGTGNQNSFHPMKGPMTTQTLRGMSTSGAMHWRGDRSTGFFGSGAYDEALSFKNFVVAFPGLLGRADQPTEAEMNKFTNFQLQVQLPPNPIRKLDNSLTSTQAAGRDFYFGSRRVDGLAIGSNTGFNCNGCHIIDAAQGHFGTDGQSSFEGISQIMKIPHVRNMYTKVGMFGFPDNSFFQHPETGPTGDQIRGFGFTHDGAVDTLFRFFSAIVFANTSIGGPLVGFRSDTERREVEAYMMAVDSDLAPIVGQQVTLTSTNASAVGARIDLLIARAKAPFVSKILGGSTYEADLVAKAAIGTRVKGFLFDRAAGTWKPDDGSANLTTTALRALANTLGQEVTFTAVPPGSGTRIALDRNLDGRLDGQ